MRTADLPRIVFVSLLLMLGAIVAPAQTFQTPVEFNQGNGAYGTGDFYPSTTLVKAPDGNLYGVTGAGGANNANPNDSGTFFKLTPSGTLTTLYSFCSLTNCADGADPVALFEGNDGNFYGVTSRGGPGGNGCVDGIGVGCGTVFQITPTGLLTTLYSFCSLNQCTDGAMPNSLIQGSDGNLYGTTWAGGRKSGTCSTSQGNGCGTFFQLTTSGVLTTLYSFCSATNCADGTQPLGAVQGRDGNFYGTTNYGGSTFSQGTIFQLTTTGTLTTLHRFGSGSDQTAWPTGQLVEGPNGNFYGTTEGGNIGGCGSNCGTVYQISTAGALSIVYRFCSLANCADGSGPNSLMLGADNNFYGTTYLGGKDTSGHCAPGCGTLFKLIPSGTLTVLHDFCSSSTSCPDGANPQAALVQLSNGTFYGTTAHGGLSANGDGTIFSWSPNVALAPTFTPATLTFANQAIDTTSTSKGITIKNPNTGIATLDFSSITVSGPFSISSKTCGATLLAGHGCTVKIAFSPTTIGPASGKLMVADNAPGTPQAVLLSGNGVGQATLTPTSLTFPTLKVGTTSGAKKAVLKNNLPTTLTGISYSTTGPFAVSSSTCVTTLASNTTCAIYVKFSPITTGTVNGTLTVSDSANNSPQTVTLIGTGD